jgi:hypothetical protein
MGRSSGRSRSSRASRVTATVTAATRCELELDSASLDVIGTTHPGVLHTLRAFSAQRLGSVDECRVRNSAEATRS